MKLTQEMVDSAPAKDTWISDGKGLLLRTRAKGGRTWYWSRSVDGRRVRERIGDAREMSLYEARQFVRGDQDAAGGRERVRMLEDRITELEAVNREQRRSMRLMHSELSGVVNRYNAMLDNLIAGGIRPVHRPLELGGLDMDERQAMTFNAPPAGTPLGRADAPPFREYCGKWIERRRGAWSKGTLGVYEAKLRNHVLPTLGDLPVASVTPAAMAEVVNNVSNGTRAHVLVCLRGSLAVALGEGAISGVNPAGEPLAGLLIAEKVETKHRDMLPVEDAPKFYASIPDTPEGQALRLLMLTATRVYAVAGGSIAEVDDDDVWTVDPARQSAGKATPRIPLSRQAVANIDGMGVRADRIRKLVAGKPFTLHGMRSTFRSWCEREGVRYEVAETQLGHSVGNKIERSYQRDDLLDQRREVLERWASYLAGE